MVLINTAYPLMHCIWLFIHPHPHFTTCLREYLHLLLQRTEEMILQLISKSMDKGVQKLTISHIRPRSKNEYLLELDTHLYCLPSYALHMTIHLPSSLLYNLSEGIFSPLASTNRRTDLLAAKQKYGQGCEKANHQSQFYHIILWPWLPNKQKRT